MLSPKELYNYMYSHAIPKHGLYGGVGRRDKFFVEYIEKNAPKTATVFDASCGRGTLIKWLNALGYDTYGSEIADWLFGFGGDLCGMPGIRKMEYSELNNIGSGVYNIVISNDVIEHLASEEEVIEAVGNLARISEKWILISTGGTRAAASHFTKEVGVSNLHTVIRPKEWWKELYEDYCDLEEDFDAAGSCFFFGTKR